ncbi:hypothetical protein EMIHUDRAFT_204702 [Emiliania huxleyi CCMP1516]|uniref:Major facilitator superfamily (MFS) profile domain-containing protein n=2 Tax=Emiliania huxleyi TaxID=2903 RepID=A0A0D3JW68_EMIH1|nr:hypothetical protein EMIHUDRAFT_204702 [Emiliania huxleyi CCMP1516]EOD27753.1 hypothetical protein EMIHUDRAFT_204702 [Emiliania huxleyi CCMP1516]|eukprot:XP_005780182.1 hypothetical protein EMIHUDRAFT_204702 [Emiliania huxleyi CCMP1516]
MWPHRNVPLGLLSNFLSTTAGSIGIARDAYVLLLPEGVGTATNVGLMEGMSGVVNLLTSFAAGVATDRCGRSPVLRLAAAACVLQASVTCLAVLYLPSRSGPQTVFVALCAASTLFGAVKGSYFVALEAIFGDSTPQARRTSFYVYKQMSATAGLSVGPLIAVACFALSHDTWTRPELVSVIVAGAAIAVAQGVVCLFFRDDGCGGARVGGLCASRRVAPFLAASSLSLGFGSGIAYKFLPLYCMQSLELTPIATHAIIALMQLTATALNLLIRRLARTTGPIGAAFLFMLVANAALALVCLSADLPVPTPAIAIAIGVRGAFMNSIGGITGAVLNDHISSEHRGKWATLQSLSKTTWSGSAFIGGALIDAVGYERTFLWPLAFHTLGMCLLLPILRSVPSEPRRRRQEEVAPLNLPATAGAGDQGCDGRAGCRASNLAV